MKRLTSAFEVVAIAAGLLIAGLLIWRPGAPAAEPSSAPLLVENVSGTIAADVVTMARGSGDVALVEFADFECPYCSRHARDIQPKIRDAFVDTGVVREVFVHLPLPVHARAGQASEAAVCAGTQGKFWEMHDALFVDPTALEAHRIAGHARTLGLDTTAFAECLDRGDARPTVDKHKRAAEALRVQATPAFFIGIVQADGSIALRKRLNGALPFDDFRAAITEVMPAPAKARMPDRRDPPPHL